MTVASEVGLVLGFLLHQPVDLGKYSLETFEVHVYIIELYYCTEITHAQVALLEFQMWSFFTQDNWALMMTMTQNVPSLFSIQVFMFPVF